MMTKKKWTWQMRKKKDETLTEALKTSGFFNAGLTPCSHTTTTKRFVEYSPPGEYLNKQKQQRKQKETHNNKNHKQDIRYK